MNESCGWLLADAFVMRSAVRLVQHLRSVKITDWLKENASAFDIDINISEWITERRGANLSNLLADELKYGEDFIVIMTQFLDFVVATEPSSC